jgi:hypothetical protein
MMIHGFPDSSRQGIDRRLPVDFHMIAVNPMDARLPEGPFTPTSIRLVFRVVRMERVRPSGERPTLPEKINQDRLAHPWLVSIPDFHLILRQRTGCPSRNGGIYLDDGVLEQAFGSLLKAFSRMHPIMDQLMEPLGCPAYEVECSREHGHAAKGCSGPNESDEGDFFTGFNPLSGDLERQESCPGISDKGGRCFHS